MQTATVGLLAVSAVLSAEAATTRSLAALGKGKDRLVLPKVPDSFDKAKKADPVPKNVVTPNIARDLEGAQAVKKAKGGRNNEGDEGDEGNEGLKDLIQDVDFDEGDEGNEGDEGIKELPRNTAKIPVSDAPDEGDEGDEGNEGDEGSGGPNRKKGSISARGVCTSSGTATTFSEMTDAHVNAVSSVTTEFCRDDFDGVLDVARERVKESGKAIAAVLAKGQADCVTSGNAFGCASASATAIAWAEASAEAHGVAVASSAEDCPCLADAEVYGALTGSIYIDLVADAFSVAEVRACSTGNQRSSATAYSECGAAAYADVVTATFARAMLEGECWTTTVSEKVGISVDGDFSSIEGCETRDSSTGEARGSTEGSIAQAGGAATDGGEGKSG